jgi:hypothetical protein
MIPHRTMSRWVAAVLLATAPFTLPACKSKNTTPTSSGPVATFTPDTAAPGAATIALLPGSASGASVNVRVTATGVNSFFGAAFRIEYDATALLFNGMTDSASFLRTGVTSSDVLFLEDHTSQTGEVVITATRIYPAPAVSVTTTSDLLVLNFVARSAIAAGTPRGRLDFGAQKQVCDGTVAAPGCGAVAVTWSGGGVSAQ